MPVPTFTLDPEKFTKKFGQQFYVFGPVFNSADEARLWANAITRGDQFIPNIFTWDEVGFEPVELGNLFNEDVVDYTPTTPVVPIDKLTEFHGICILDTDDEGVYVYVPLLNTDAGYVPN